MIRYRREKLPDPLLALAWRDPNLVVVVADHLGAREARTAAVAAIRKLPRHQRFQLSALAGPALVLAQLGGEKVLAAALAASTVAATATVVSVGEMLPVPNPDPALYNPAVVPAATTLHPPQPARERPGWATKATPQPSATSVTPSPTPFPVPRAPAAASSQVPPAAAPAAPSPTPSLLPEPTPTPTPQATPTTEPSPPAAVTPGAEPPP